MQVSGRGLEIVNALRNLPFSRHFLEIVDLEQNTFRVIGPLQANIADNTAKFSTTIPAPAENRFTCMAESFPKIQFGFMCTPC